MALLGRFARVALRPVVLRCTSTRHMSGNSAAQHPNFAGYADKLAFRGTHEPFQCFRVMDESGALIGGTEVDVDKETALRIYDRMIRLSILDSIFYEAQRQGRLSFYMEAATVGSAAALSDKDVIFGQYRETGALLWRGFTFDQCANQCLGNKLDPGKGRQMPIHYGSKEFNFQTISSPLGTQLPQAAGAGYALRQEGADHIAVCYFGDGSASEGDFHPAMNFAATLKCHTMFICRNNGYAISTPVHDQYFGDGIAGRGPGYGVPTCRVDGNDVWAVYYATKRAREIILETGSPVLLEYLSYRGGHHSTSDDATRYRPADELSHWTTTNNPISRLFLFLQQRGWFSQDEDKALRDLVRGEVLSALDHAEHMHKPAINELFLDVYDKPTPELDEQRRALHRHLAKYPEEYSLDHYDGSL